MADIHIHIYEQFQVTSEPNQHVSGLWEDSPEKKPTFAKNVSVGQLGEQVVCHCHIICWALFYVLHLFLLSPHSLYFQCN